MNNFDIQDGITINNRQCKAVVIYSPTGAEIWLYIDKQTGELLLAERIDGEWTDLDLKTAEQDYSQVLYAAR